MNDLDNNEEFDNEIDFIELFSILWLNKKFILIFTTFAAVTSVFYSLSLTNIYNVQTLLTPTTSSGSNLMSQYSGLASMAGVNLPNASSENKVDVALNLIKSKMLKGF